MDKSLLQQQVLTRLETDLQVAQHAAKVAHETATHEENIAENKYDTLGLEAAYLATGQARRVEAIRQTIATWRQLRLRAFSPGNGIELGALICLVDEHSTEQLMLLGPNGASMKLVHEGLAIQVISHDAPLGKAMIGKGPGDEVSLKIATSTQHFEILWVE
ncbi:GreA/GreB family elongation factor [Pseudomonas sp. EL_65y_Pfl2_R95]|uniref:GreA/GreB family elongation factor n=1 Tax=Pseudomonas sp. EL_65y_Pfl2_R95 TaxID=3088698 RepID=UPI0030DB7C76